jgi:hypothetical protein
MCGAGSQVSPIKCVGRYFYLEDIHPFPLKFKHSNNHALKIRSFLTQWSQLLGRPKSGGVRFQEGLCKKLSRPHLNQKARLVNEDPSSQLNGRHR